MWLEPPAKPSANTEKALLDLANYYRQLVVYHQQSAAIAASELARLETSIDTNFARTPVWQPPTPPVSWMDRDLAKLIAELAETPRNLRSASDDSLPEVRLFGLEELTQSLKQILTVNRTKILRLDYLVLEIGEKQGFSREQQAQLKPQIERILEKGAIDGFWAKVPDSPDCWTLDLRDFPDLLSEAVAASDSSLDLVKKPNKTKRIAYNRSRLPSCPKLERYETLTASISECLKEKYPHSIDAHGILRWLYNPPLEGKALTKAYQAVSDGLNKGCNRKYWYRAEIGRYIWKAEDN
jgi:hypothetical protein